LAKLGDSSREGGDFLGLRTEIAILSSSIVKFEFKEQQLLLWGFKEHPDSL